MSFISENTPDKNTQAVVASRPSVPAIQAPPIKFSIDSILNSPTQGLSDIRSGYRNTIPQPCLNIQESDIEDAEISDDIEVEEDDMGSVSDDTAMTHDNCINDDNMDDPERYSWLHCTRYKPPKLPRSKRKDVCRKRKLGRNPRVPFTQHQVSLLEAKFRQTHYLSSVDVAELSAALNLTETRVKIWFQNRRARERRDKHVTTELLKESPPGGVLSPDASNPSGMVPIENMTRPVWLQEPKLRATLTPASNALHSVLQWNQYLQGLYGTYRAFAPIQASLQYYEAASRTQTVDPFRHSSLISVNSEENEHSAKTSVTPVTM